VLILFIEPDLNTKVDDILAVLNWYGVPLISDSCLTILETVFTVDEIALIIDILLTIATVFAVDKVALVLNSDFNLPRETTLTDSVIVLTNRVLVVKPGAGKTKVGIPIFT
jgi:hypothetical protein